MVTDETDTYVILNYYDIRWVGGGSDQHCDRMLGIRTGQYPDCKPGHVSVCRLPLWLVLYAIYVVDITNLIVFGLDIIGLETNIIVKM